MIFAQMIPSDEIAALLLSSYRVEENKKISVQKLLLQGTVSRALDDING